MTKQPFIDPVLLEKCLTETTKCPLQEQESCPLILLGSNLRGSATNALNFLTSPETLEALNSVAQSKDEYSEECLSLISNLNNAVACAIMDAYNQYGSVEFPSDLSKLNEISLVDIKQLWTAIELISNLTENDELENQFVAKFAGIIWHGKMPSSLSEEYICSGVNQATQEREYLPIQITYPKVNDCSDLTFEFESSIPLGSCGKVHITSNSSSDEYHVLKLVPTEDDSITTALAFEAANITLPQPFVTYIGIDIDGFPFIAISKEYDNDSWLNFNLEDASLFNSACQLMVLNGLKYTYQESAELIEQLINACTLSSLQDILIGFKSYFEKLAIAKSSEKVTTNHKVDNSDNDLKLERSQIAASLLSNPPSPEIISLARKGNINALYELALYARNFDVMCSIGLCARAEDIYSSLFRYDKNSVNTTQQDSIHLLYVLTDPGISLKNLRYELRTLINCPYEPIARNAREVLEAITPNRSIIDRIKYWWKRPWGNWRSLPLSNATKDDTVLNEDISVLELDDIRPWRGRYFICITSEVDKKTGLLARYGIHTSPSQEKIDLNEAEEEYLKSEIRNQHSAIENLSSTVLLYARKHTETWQPYSQGWRILEETKDLITKPEMLVEFNPSASH